MKKALFIVTGISILNLIFISCASMMEMQSDMREITIVENNNLTKDEAFDKTMRWIASYYNSANNVIQLSDKENGTIIINAAHRVSRAGGLVSYPLSYTMTIDIKENRIRFKQRIGSPLDPEIGGVTRGDAEEMHIYFKDLRTSLLSQFEIDDDF